ncbi:MAG: NADH-ubiquinone oxidoreductase-F iron-sulfur binding region domain-containing protein [Methanomassiliicoccales archaeon]
MKANELLETAVSEREKRESYAHRINVCCSSGCIPFGAEEVLESFEEEVQRKGLEEECKVARTGCIGTCSVGPAVLVEPGDHLYQSVTVDTAKEIVQGHIVDGSPVEEHLYPSERFFEKQKRLVLKNAGKIDPLRIEDYIAEGGYSALIKCLQEMDREEVIEEVFDSGLRGRGGAGFQTGQKWKFVDRATGRPKYIIANLDEGDPGVFANRTLAEADPHAIIEGMLIASYALQAEHGYIYIRAEYPLGVETLKKALKAARSYGLLGEDILGTGMKFDIELRLGAGAFIAGEETAILASVEGYRAMPRPRPPYPANEGLWGKPTLVQNVETLANVPQIILNGSEWFSRIGSPSCTGTKCFSLTGNITNPGLIEVPMGITLREVVFEIGGGVADDRDFKAVLVGGPSGGCLPESMLHLPIDYESLTEAGAIMGSGGIVVIDNKACIVNTAHYFVDFCVDESCGRCSPCRVGLDKLKGIYGRIMRCEGTEADLEFLGQAGEYIKEASLCGLGQTAPNPVLTTLRYFREEYMAHVVEGRCPTGRCPMVRSREVSR